MNTLQECVDLFEGSTQGRVDREAGVIRGVKILGWKSANGREYDPDGVDPSLYEGKPVNVNHARGERSAYDRFGRTINVTKRASGLYGDLEYLKSHPLAPAVTEAAERMPGVYGLSHTARGRSRAGKGGVVIEQVESVQSVDLVGDPATVAGLYESRGVTMSKTLNQLHESLRRKRPGYARALQEMAEAGIMGPDSPMPEPDGDEAAGGEEGDHEQAILDAAKAVLDDMSLDTPAKLAKIKKLLGILDGPDAGAVPPPGDQASADSGASSEESIKGTLANLREELATLKARERLRKAADEAGVRISTSLLESIRPTITEQQAKTLVAELKQGTTSGGAGQGQGQRPRSATPGAGTLSGTRVTESKDQKNETLPQDSKARARWLAGN